MENMNLIFLKRLKYMDQWGIHVFIILINKLFLWKYYSQFFPKMDNWSFHTEILEVMYSGGGSIGLRKKNSYIWSSQSVKNNLKDIKLQVSLWDHHIYTVFAELSSHSFLQILLISLLSKYPLLCIQIIWMLPHLPYTSFHLIIVPFIILWTTPTYCS